MPKPGEENWRTIWRRREKAGTTKLSVSPPSTEQVPELKAPSDEIAVIAELDTAHEVQTPADDEKKEIKTAEEVCQETDLEKASDNKEDEQDPVIDLKPLNQPAKAELYSELSIVLTLISILVAFAISIIEFMGIALEKCASCAEAAENSSGLDGRWWRFWGACNDSSGYIGAGIVGVMLLCGAVFLGVRRYRRKQAERMTPTGS